MTENCRNDLSNEEQEAFRSLREAQLHSIGDERRIVRALRKRGLIRSSIPRAWRWLIQSAAAAAVLAGTFFMGAQYGSRSGMQVEPVTQPVREELFRQTLLIAERMAVEDTSSLEDYRDEPDRPGNGDVLFAKIVN